MPYRDPEPLLDALEQRRDELRQELAEVRMQQEPKSRADARAGAPARVRVGSKGGLCQVTVNGTRYGATPVEVQVSSGTARVSCKPARGPWQSQAVEVESGEIARVSFQVTP